MTQDFKAGDLVEWNSEAGRVRGTIKKKLSVPDGIFSCHVARISRPCR
jgi:hypothetical protein